MLITYKFLLRSDFMILYTHKKINFLQLIQLSTPRLLYVGELDSVELRMAHRLAHHHDHLEIMYVFEGSGIITINEKDHFVNTGDLIIYNSHIVHDESRYRPKIGAVYLGVSHLLFPGLPPTASPPTIPLRLFTVVS